MLLRLTLDVNVWVNHYLALFKGKEGSAAQLLVRSAFDGHCRLGLIQPVISYAMLDTLQEVLARLGLPEVLAEAARSAVEGSATNGVVREPPHIVVASGVEPVRDAEDRGVLETAIAGHADLLVTNNIADFAPGSRAAIGTEIVRLAPTGKPDVLLYPHPRLQHGLVISTVPAARAWLLDGRRPPNGLLERFMPAAMPPGSII